jgi:RNA polymerase sigma-70 factor (ECF subfamily)
MALALRMLRNRLDAEEALQDAFVRAYRGLEGFEEGSTFGTWFYRILYNVCLTRLGARKADIESVDFSDESGEQFDPSILACDGLAGEIEARDITRMVHQTLDELPPKYATILSLFYLQERSHEEIVEITAMPIGTVKTHLFRARELLRKALVRRLSGEGVAA